MNWTDKICGDDLLPREEILKLVDRGSFLNLLSKIPDTKICELGVRDGNHFKAIKRMVKPALLVGVDIWNDDGVFAHNDCIVPKEVLRDFFRALVKEYVLDPGVRLIRDYTQGVAPLFPDEFFDLVYVDADHTLEGCLGDMESWYPKVKKGSLMVGDDYKPGFPGVLKAVEQFLKIYTPKFFHTYSDQWLIIR